LIPTNTSENSIWRSWRRIGAIGAVAAVLLTCSGAGVLVSQVARDSHISIDTKGQPYDGRGFWLSGILNYENSAVFDPKCRFLIRQRVRETFTGVMGFPNEQARFVQGEPFTSTSTCV